MINNITLVGRLTKNVDLKTTQSGISVANFTLAVDRDFKNASGEKETDFIPIVAWRGLAENAARFLDKGKLAAVTGSLQMRSYEDKDGNKRLVAEVLASGIQFLSPRPTQNDEVVSEYDEKPALSDEEVPF